MLVYRTRLRKVTQVERLVSFFMPKTVKRKGKKKKVDYGSQLSQNSGQPKSRKRKGLKY